MGRTRNLGVDLAALRRAMPRRTLRRNEATEIAARVLGTEDEWTIIFALRALPFVDGFVAGTWRIEKGKLLVEPFAPLPLK
jgi:hypothetical protein